MTSVPPVAESTLLGAVLLIKHGDREGFFQDPLTYTASNTAITPLGNAQSFQLGQQIRDIYFNASSSYFLSGVNSTIVQDGQVNIAADGGGERGVIFNSAVSFLQGLFPGTSSYETTLANGTTISGPLNGYQTVPIASVNPNNDVSLEGFTSCNTFIAATSDFYASPAFKQVESDHADFLNSLPPFLDGRNTTLENMFNIFDYMNVNFIHNATFAKNLPPTYLAQARALADYHENGVFSSASPSGPGNIAGQTIIPSILSGIEGITNSSNPTKLVVEAISYKPFISLFNMTGIAAMTPKLYGIVEYSSAAVFEVWQPNSGSEPVVRFVFKNGTQDQFNAYPLMNSTNTVPVSTFVDNLQPLGFADTPTWCTVCQNNQDRGCGALAAAASKGAMMSAEQEHHFSPVGAGFIGAGVTLALIIGAVALLSFSGFIEITRRKNYAKKLGSDAGSERKA